MVNVSRTTSNDITLVKELIEAVKNLSSADSEKMDTFDSDDELSFVPPDHFICPITFEVMKDPVICSDGITYEREDITKWLEKHNTSPKTKDVLMNKTLIPNKAIKAAIEKMKQEHPDWDEVETKQQKKDKKKPSTAIKLQIKTLSRQGWTIDADKNDTVQKIKEKVYDLEGIKPCKMRLIYSGKLLDDDRTLREYGIEDRGTLHLVLRCLGG